MVRELGDLIGRRGAPKMIVSDNGTELTSRAVLAWSGDVDFEWHYIAPGEHPQFIAGTVDTGLIGRDGDALAAAPEPSPEALSDAARALAGDAPLAGFRLNTRSTLCIAGSIWM